MVIIKDYKAIYEYRVRREKRLDGKRLDDEWKTIKGTHVMVDDDGKISKGPENLRGLSKKSELKIGKEMSPINSDYVYDEGDDEQDFTHKNIKKLKPIYDEHGLSACHDEWYKFRLADSTKDIHPISKDEADEVMYDNVRQSIYDGWFRNADSSYKPQLTDAVIKNPEMRNAALNLAYENYRNSVDKPLSFEEFLVTPIKMYRGENGQRHLEDDVFDAYTFDRKIAEHFASKPGRGESKVIEIEVRPIDTYGSMRAVGEAEIWIPRQLSPVGYKEDQKDPRMDGVDWEIYNPIKFILEDFVEVVEEDDENDELIDSIMQEAETIKLFSDKNNEVSKSMVSRCADSIQRTILQLMLKMLPSNEDSAFFAGELNENIGERNVQYPEVEAFRERRQKRLDAKNDEDEGRWVTTEEKHKIHINEEGVPDKGNPHVIKAMKSGSRTREEIGKARIEKVRGRITESLSRYKEYDAKVKESASKYADAAQKLKKAESRVKSAERYKTMLEGHGVKEGDRDRLQKEVDELQKKKEENPYDRDISGEYNSKSFMLAMYDDAFGEETKEYQRNLEAIRKEAEDSKRELDKNIADRKVARDEIREHSGRKNVQSLKFYTDDERADIKRHVMEQRAFNGLSDEEKEKIGASIDGASDAQLSILKKTSEKAHIMRQEDTAVSGSCYRDSNGVMYLEAEDRQNPKVFWHEYGHFMDDFKHSGLEDSVVTHGEGTKYEGSSNTFSSILADDVKIFGKDAEKDLQEFFDKVAPGEFRVKASDDEGYLSILSAKDGALAEDSPTSAWNLQQAFDKAIDVYLDGGPNGGKLAEYRKSIGYPDESERPNRDDYIETYVTPKRKLEREREKYKGAEEEYYRLLNEYYGKQREVQEQHPEYSDVVSSLLEEKSEREKKVSAVTDCLCACMFGQVFSIYGCHDRDYYRTGGHAEKEWAANIQQMMFMGEKDVVDTLTQFMPRTMKKVKAAYNEYIWRNLSE